MIVRLPISKIVEMAAVAPNKSDKIEVLRKWDHPALRAYLAMAFNTEVKWLIPEGRPPYTPTKEIDVEWALYGELRRMYLFVDTPTSRRLTDAKRESLFITLLESMTPDDALFLCDVVKDHKIPEGLELQIVKEAFGV